MNYKLTLTTEQGVVLETWVLSTDPNSETADVLVPLAKLGPQTLADEINREIKYAEDANT